MPLPSFKNREFDYSLNWLDILQIVMFRKVITSSVRSLMASKASFRAPRATNMKCVVRAFGDKGMIDMRYSSSGDDDDDEVLALSDAVAREIEGEVVEIDTELEAIEAHIKERYWNHDAIQYVMLAPIPTETHDYI